MKLKSLLFLAVGAVVVLASTRPATAASPSQIGVFQGTLKSKGFHPLTGDKISTKSIAILSVAADNSTVLTIDGVKHYGGAENFFSGTGANLGLLGPGPTIINAPIVIKKGKVKGTISCVSLTNPLISSAGKLKLKLTSIPPHAGFFAAIESPNVPAPIPDASTLNSTLNVDDAGPIRDIRVIVDINHTWDEDLDISLISPAGTIVLLSSDNGGSGDNYKVTIFDDKAAQSITAGAAPFNGTYQPEESLSVLKGESPVGTWTLRISDDEALLTGTLNYWAISINNEPLVLQ